MSQANVNRPAIRRINLVIDCPDPGELSEFYSNLLGWPVSHPSEGGWAAITSPAGDVIAFQAVADYQPPVWPWQPGRQAQMLHLDFWVDDLNEGVRHAQACGARLADTQYYTTSRTMFDPAGHPFCIDTDGEEPPA